MKLSKYILSAVLSATLGLTATSCLEEAFPTTQASSGQLETADKAAMSAAIMSKMTEYSSSYDYMYCDLGFGGFQIWYDCMAGNFPPYDSGYDYFYNFNLMNPLGNNNGASILMWMRYYSLASICSNVIKTSDPNNEADARYLGNAYAYRAWAYMDLARLFEYKHTGVSYLDGVADSRKIWGLTVPIVTEKTTETETRTKTRAPFYEMYRFIFDDLNRAEESLEGITSVPSKDYASIGVVYGLKARLWMELGSRFDIYPADMSAQLEAENQEALSVYDKLGIHSAADCYNKAIEYAQKARQGYTPTTKAQWFDKANGFNTPIDSWMWCVIVNSNSGMVTSEDWHSFPSFLSPEAEYGMCNIDYNIERMIQAKLYAKLQEGDWRKPTWINPNEVGSQSAYNAKYKDVTSLSYEAWSEYPAYTGFKFHPAQGNGKEPTVGNAISYPLMRVEEMYLIEAEAIARTQGAAAAVSALESFMNSYRTEGTTYTCPSMILSDVINEILDQKCIEFWGEGISMWDYKRTERTIQQGYPGTNVPSPYRFNSITGFVAPWLNLFIPEYENGQAPSVILNPDPTLSLGSAWTE